MHPTRKRKRGGKRGTKGKGKRQTDRKRTKRRNAKGKSNRK